MSHVDDGTLHAYLDGELSAVERERLEAHLAGCEPCQARLAEERGLVERASRILGQALPPVHSPPPFTALRRPQRGWRPALPIVWAATVLLALGIGWYARDLRAPRRATDLGRTGVPVANRPASPPAAPEARGRLDAPTAKVATRPVAPTSAGRTEPFRAVPSAEPETAQAADHLAPAAQRPGLRGAAAPAAAAGNAIVLEQPTVAASSSSPRLSTTWPLIEPRPARDVLGTEPVTIPGYPVRALRRNPADAAQILVEQEIAGGHVVLLFESKIAPAALQERGSRDEAATGRQRANERLARFIGALRIEISGTLPIDSLSKLLEQVR
jgi:anti-sigma factor RsiW